jgi:sugar O-acyltransferase (sialic acid O-acetyltransferase NeuD family)
MKKLYIFGAGGLGKELFYDIISNKDFNNKYKVAGFIVDYSNEVKDNVFDLNSVDKNCSVLIALGNQYQRKKIHEKLKNLGFNNFPNYISKNVIMTSKINLGIGNIILAGTILTVDIQFGNFNLINLGCTIGHNVVLKDYITLSSKVSISGNCLIHSNSFLGTSSTLLPKVIIEENVTVGAGSVVLKRCLSKGTYFGVPALRIV